MTRHLKINLSVLILIISFIGPASFASSSIEAENEKPFKKSSSSSLMKEIETLKSKIKRSQDKRDVSKLLELNKKFKKLNYDSEQWESQSKKLAIEKWPSQSWKESVGGFLFYPADMDHFLACDSTEHLALRRDILWSLGVAAEYKNPLAQYYLARGLDTLQASHSLEPRPAFITSLYTEALSLLEKCPNRPEACYILAQNYSCDAAKVGLKEFNLDTALDFHAKGSQTEGHAGLCNRFAHLVKRSLYERLETPKAKEYRALNYGPAYAQAGHLAQKSKKKQKLYEEAVNQGFPQAHLSLGALHERKGRKEEAVKAYEEAGNQGVPRGYVTLSHSLIGDRTLKYGTNKDLTQVPREDVDRAATYLHQAGEAGDFEGWDQLVSLHQHLYELYKNEDDLSKLISALEKGLEMGSSHAHRKAQLLFPAKYDQLVARYGQPTQRELHIHVSRILRFNSEKAPS
jgi:hypothetical protein